MIDTELEKELWAKATLLSEQDKLKLIYLRQKRIIKERIFEFLLKEEDRSDEELNFLIDAFVLNSLRHHNNWNDITEELSTIDLYENKDLVLGVKNEKAYFL
jgi:hypothetical protein